MASSGMPINPARLTGGTAAGARLRFTTFSRMARGSYSGYDLYACGTWSFSSLDVRDCVFQGGNIMLDADAGGGVGAATLLNNLCERQAFSVFGEPTLYLHNNLFKDCGVVSFDVWGGTSVLRDNVFDSVVLDDMFDPPQTHGHNAYINVKDNLGNPARLAPPQDSDVVLSGFTYASGPLGAYYQPADSPLLNAGSRSAADAGLSHYTVLADQTKAGRLGNGQVSIGFHYVAVDATSQPVDADSDGLPDYVEDTDGNGSWNGWPETDWMNPDTDNDGLPDGVDADPLGYDSSPPVFVITAPAEGAVF